LKLKYCVNTHCHADHVTSSGKIKKNFNSNVKSIISALSEAQADIKINDGDKIKFGEQELSCLSTPGHTNGCFSYVDHKHKFVFTGDTLLVRGCGRTDFQKGSSASLYESVHKKIFTLPDDYIVLPAHDYKGFTSSTVGEEKLNNPRLTKSKDEFIQFMNNLKLDMPKLIDVAVPANLVCGIQETSN
jgi:sulfur dioxygenase